MNPAPPREGVGISRRSWVNPKELGKIGVLAGGPSSEREISLESGIAVFKALKEAGAAAVFLDIKNERSIRTQIRNAGIDVAFVALHGRFGEDGTVQAILEDMNIPYTGSGPQASRLTLDKIASREIFVKNNIDVPRYKTLNKEFCNDIVLKTIVEDIKFPLVVKPQFEGSSIGISIVRQYNELKEAVGTAFKYDDNIIIDKYIKGRELTVGILADEPLPVIEIIVNEVFYDFKAKYKSDNTQYITPAKINNEYYKIAQHIGKLAHKSLGCNFFSRVDMILDEKQKKFFVLEVNSIPGFTSHSLLPKAAAHAGIGFSQLCLKLVESALRKAEVGAVGQKSKEV